MPADYDELMTFVQMIARMTPVDITEGDEDEVFFSSVEALNRLITSARKMSRSNDIAN